MRIWQRFGKIIKLLIVVAVFLLLHYLGALKFLESWVSGAANPFLQYFGMNFKSNSNDIDWQQKAEELQDEKESLLVEAGALAAMEEENDRLREILNFSNRQEQILVVADLIFEDNFLSPTKNSYNLVINRGASDGLKAGQVVLSPDGAVVGKVLETKEFSSRICFLNSASCRLAVAVTNSDKTIGISGGDLGLTVKLDYVSQAEKISLGDIVVTSGSEKDIPAGLPLGTVSRIDSQDNDVWQDINISPIVDLDRLRLVSVLIKN